MHLHITVLDGNGRENTVYGLTAWEGRCGAFESPARQRIRLHRQNFRHVATNPALSQSSFLILLFWEYLRGTPVAAPGLNLRVGSTSRNLRRCGTEWSALSAVLSDCPKTAGKPELFPTTSPFRGKSLGRVVGNPDIGQKTGFWEITSPQVLGLVFRGGGAPAGKQNKRSPGGKDQFLKTGQMANHSRPQQNEDHFQSQPAD